MRPSRKIPNIGLRNGRISALTLPSIAMPNCLVQSPDPTVRKPQLIKLSD